MREITYLEAIREAMQKTMRKDKNVYLIGEDIAKFGGAFGVTKGMLEEFSKKRVIDTPISEEAIIGIGVGSAITGMRPIAEMMFIDFITIAMDEIVNQAAKLHYMSGGKVKVPLVIRTTAGAGLGLAAQHSQSLEALVAHIPGLKVVMPSCPYDAKGLLIASIDDNNPVIFIEHTLLYKNIQPVPEYMYEIPLGKGEIKRTGTDISIVATSFMVQRSLEAAQILKDEEKIECEIIDLRTIRPLDINIVLDSIKKTGTLLCVEESCSFGGFMGEIISQVAEKGFDYLDTPMVRISGLDSPVPYSLVLEQEMVPSIAKIKKGILKILNKA